jgi:hypothetical protein
MPLHCFPRIFLNLIILLSLTLPAHAQDTTRLKRPAYTLRVAVDNQTFYEQNIKSTPYLLPDTAIQLYPGETVYIEVNQENGVIKKMIAVPEIKDSAKTITISFWQETKGKVHSLMMLKVINPFPYQFLYKARIYLLTQKKWVGTDVYPVEPSLSGYETWPDIITSIALNGWKFQSK